MNSDAAFVSLCAINNTRPKAKAFLSLQDLIPYTAHAKIGNQWNTSLKALISKTIFEFRCKVLQIFQRQSYTLVLWPFISRWMPKGRPYIKVICNL